MKSCFISYSYDSHDHTKWVKRLATKLKKSGVDVRLDALDAQLGDDIVQYMIQAVDSVDRVVVICTPNYNQKMSGGAAFEKMLMAGELAEDAFTNKFIPILRDGHKDTAIPRFLHTKLYHSMPRKQITAQDIDKISNAIRARRAPLRKAKSPRKTKMVRPKKHNNNAGVGRIHVVGLSLLAGRGSDGVRYLWQKDGSKIFTESIAFNTRLKAPEKPDKGNNISAYTTSVSFGCQLANMGMPCAFCATGKLKFNGNMTAEEIALQNIFMAEYDSSCPSWPEVRNQSREFAFMGQGEPGFSYPQIRRAILLTDAAMDIIGQSVHRYIISSAGITEMLDALILDYRAGTFKHPVTVHFSLHAIAPERQHLMPIDRLYSHQRYLRRAQEIFELTDEKMAVGILLFDKFASKDQKGTAFTTTPKYLNRMLDLLDPNFHRIDLCDVNISRVVESQRQVSNESARGLRDQVRACGFEVKLFSSFGAAENSGCGMLASSKAKVQKPGKTTMDQFEAACNLLADVLSNEE